MKIYNLILALALVISGAASAQPERMACATGPYTSDYRIEIRNYNQMTILRDGGVVVSGYADDRDSDYTTTRLRLQDSTIPDLPSSWYLEFPSNISYNATSTLKRRTFSFSGPPSVQQWTAVCVVGK